MKKPRLTGKDKFKQQISLKENLKGYVGKDEEILLRSGYEIKAVRMIQQLYTLKRIKSWVSEETIFQYYHNLTNKVRKYFMDFTLELYNGCICYIEVKPFAQTQNPKKPKTFKTEKQRVNYEKQVIEYLKNQDKWNAVQEFCNTENQKLGYTKHKFIIWTENELSI